ncbi:MAG: hypothetical protein IJK87_11990 [Prevotella sp.]|nr:hypothetical protein [Prevotella sp.]
MPIVRYFIFLFFLFAVIYPVIWQFFPVAFSRLLGAAGIVLALFTLRSAYVAKVFREIVFGYVLLIFIAFFQSTVNNSMDIEYLKHVLILPILNLFAGYVLYSMVDKEDRSFGRLCDSILFVAVIQAFISFAMFLSPELTNTIHSMIEYNEGTEEKLETLTHRLMGVGQAFWGAGVNYGIDILILSVLPDVKGSIICKYKILYWSITAILLLAGIFSARTFFISFIFIALYFVLMKKNIFVTIVHSYKYILIIPIFLFLYHFLRVQLGTKFEKVEAFTYELFNNYEESGEFESSSTNKLKNMYDILPSETKTWIIGDGKFKNDDGTYYMYTDVGYSRHIFFYGLIGLIPFLIVLLFVYKTCARQYHNHAIKTFIWILFLFELTLNFKALMSLSPYWGLFLAWGAMNRDKENELIKNELIRKSNN